MLKQINLSSQKFCANSMVTNMQTHLKRFKYFFLINYCGFDSTKCSHWHFFSLDQLWKIVDFFILKVDTLNRTTSDWPNLHFLPEWNWIFDICRCDDSDVLNKSLDLISAKGAARRRRAIHMTITLAINSGSVACDFTVKKFSLIYSAIKHRENISLRFESSE